jgi:hypothetical protein
MVQVVWEMTLAIIAAAAALSGMIVKYVEAEDILRAIAVMVPEIVAGAMVLAKNLSDCLV